MGENENSLEIQEVILTMEYNKDLKKCAETCTNYVSGDPIEPCYKTRNDEYIRCAKGFDPN